MRIKTVHHVQITVPVNGLDEARRFYQGVLELAEIPRDQSEGGRPGFWLEAGGVQIHVGVEDGVDRAATRAHVAYEVDDLTKWRSRLDALGIRIVPGRPIPGMERFDIRDPFGNRIEMLQCLTPPNR